MARRFPDATRYLIGDSGIAEYAHYVDELKARVNALGLADRVIFAGWRDDALALRHETARRAPRAGTAA